MLAQYGGELAALATALLWSATAVFFTYAGREVGSVVVNRIRLIVALLLLGATHWLVVGDPLPLGAEPERWMWLGLSGVVGLVGGDSFLFQAYLWVGPRLGMLMMSLAPVLAALLAFAFLGEGLVTLQWLGILVTISGVGLVVLDRERPADLESPNLHYGRGILFGVGAALGQAVGLVLAKQGLAGDFPALSGTLMRMSAAVVVLWTLTVMTGRAGSTLRTVAEHRGAFLPIVGGAATGPFVGVWLSLLAIQLTRVGVASTLMALSPIFLLPVGRLLFREQIGWQSVTGTLVAVAGVAMLFMA